MRRKGQHFLVESATIERIAGYAELTGADCVLEIGPGTGSLTAALAARAGHVYAVEVDPVLAEDLCGRYPNVTVIRSDALTFLPEGYNKVVSNLPYQISSKITYRLLSRPFDLAVLMYQREFARRMLAPPGSREYGRLAMVVGLLCDAEVLETVKRSAFRPVPEVASAVVRLRRRRVEVDLGRFMRLAEVLFTHRRKKVRRALESLGVSREEMAGIDPEVLERRPEQLTPEEAAGIVRAMG